MCLCLCVSLTSLALGLGVGLHNNNKNACKNHMTQYGDVGEEWGMTRANEVHVDRLPNTPCGNTRL